MLAPAIAFAGDDLPAPVDWTGFYLGIQGGVGTGPFGVVTESDTDPLDGLVMDFDIGGGLVGGTVGANVQAGTLVFGIEGDLAWSDLHGDADPITIGNSAPAVLTGTIDWLGTLRGRVGVAAESLLFYATAGLAAGGVNGVVTNYPHDGMTSTIGGTQYGYAAGAGIEAAVADNVTLKVEYLYVDLGTASYQLAPDDNVMALTAHGHPSASLVRFGLNYRF